jgi:ABC-type nitrate/sulfonate/bicarbonate transport system substrate-binding protein
VSITAVREESTHDEPNPTPLLDHHLDGWHRRPFPRSAVAGRGCAPETAAVSLTKLPTICVAPQYAAEKLLLAEGFAGVRYVGVETGVAAIEAIGRGEVDFGVNFAATLVTTLNSG